MFKEIAIKEENEIVAVLTCHLNCIKDDEVIKKYLCVNHKLSYVEFNKILNCCKDNISIILSMYVDEERRGNGHGHSLIESFLLDNKGSVILIADSQETPWIESFYEKHGFKVVSYIHGFPIMVKE